MDFARSINYFATENSRSCSAVNPFNLSSAAVAYEA